MWYCLDRWCGVHSSMVGWALHSSINCTTGVCNPTHGACRPRARAAAAGWCVGVALSGFHASMSLFGKSFACAYMWGELQIQQVRKRAAVIGCAC